MVYVDRVNKSHICYEHDENDMCCAYREYCVSLLKDALKRQNYPINIIFGRSNYNFNNNNKTYKTDFQIEHTLVKEGGRSVDEIVYGKVPHKDGNYLIRIADYSYYKNLDFIIEYSLPNIYNISTNPIFENFLKKVIYIAPTIFNECDFTNKKKTNIVTSFIDPHNERRNSILNKFSNQNILINQIKGYYTKEKLSNIYNTTKITINIHQTDHHHTFEELRVLPALMKGVLVISEDVPLKEKIPYWEHIIWCKYSEITDCVIEVNKNYEHFYKKIFTSNLKNILDTMRLKNKIQLKLS